MLVLLQACAGAPTPSAPPSVEGQAWVEEACNGLDDDGDGEIDDGLPASVFYRDADHDGYGGTTTTEACAAPPGWEDGSDDCDDSDKFVHPYAPEQCDEVDNDCDALIDEGVARSWYLDTDGDGYGAGVPVEACEAPTGHVSAGADCDDADPDLHPNQQDLCDGVDRDCDTDLPPTETDADGDGVLACDGDCDDSGTVVTTTAVEVCDGMDNDCDGEIDEACVNCNLEVPGDADSIQAAIDGSSSGDVICVATGTWFENLDFKGAAVTLLGLGGPDGTVVNGGAAGRVIEFHYTEEADSVLSGFSLTGGAEEDGGGVRLSGASPTLTNLVIYGNVAAYEGAGIFIHGGAPALSHIRVEANTSSGPGYDGYSTGYAGGLYLTGTQATLDNMVIADNDNQWGGGGVYVNGGEVTLTNTQITGNRSWACAGGGVFVVDGRLSATNVLIANNLGGTACGESGGGAGLEVVGESAEISLTNVLITNNELVAYGDARSSGGGIYMQDGTLILNNVAVTGNIALLDGGGIHADSGTVTISNSDVWGNTPLEAGGIVDLTHTNSVDPLLLDDAGHLDATSPLVDAGDPAILDPDGSPSDIGVFGGPGAAAFDLDADGLPAWWLPGPWDATTSPGTDCDDTDAYGPC